MMPSSPVHQPIGQAEPENGDGNRPGWRFVEGSVSVSVSTLLAILLSECACAGLPLLGYLSELTDRPDGVIIVATLLLFPTTLALYGGFAVFYSAKEFVEKRARRRGRAEGRVEGIAEGLKKGREEGHREGRQEGQLEGRQEGRQSERERISQAMAARGAVISPELAEILADDAE